MTVLECKIQRGSIRHTNGQGTGSSSVVYVIDTNDNSAGPLTVRTEAQTLPGLQDPLPVRNAPCVILGDTDGTIYVQSISMAQQDQPSTRCLSPHQLCSSSSACSRWFGGGSSDERNNQEPVVSCGRLFSCVIPVLNEVGKSSLTFGVAFSSAVVQTSAT